MYEGVTSFKDFIFRNSKMTHELPLNRFVKLKLDEFALLYHLCFRKMSPPSSHVFHQQLNHVITDVYSDNIMTSLYQ